MSASPPRPSVHPSSLVLTATSASLVASLEVVNRGGGRLSATLESDVPWIVVEPRVIEENHVRVAVNVFAGILPEDRESTGKVTLRWGKLALEVPVRITRAGMARAWRLLEEGRRDDARELARTIAQTSGAVDAPLLIATVGLEEGNHPAAVRAVLDATVAVQRAVAEGRPVLEGPWAAAELERFLRAADASLDDLRDARFCLPLLDALVQAAVPARLGVEPPALALLQRSAGRFVDQFPPSTLGEADLAATIALVERMRHEFPADPRWIAWLARRREPEAPPQGHAASTPTADGGRWRPFGAAALVALAFAVAAVLFWPKVRLHEAQTLLEAGRYADALEVVRRASEGGLETSDTRALRSRIHFEWARTLFTGGEPGKGAEQLALALHDDRDNPDMLAFKRSAYRAWADTAMARGRVLEACEALNELTTMKPPEAGAQKQLDALRPLWRVYTVLDEIVAQRRDPASDGPTVPLDLKPGPEVAGWSRFLRDNHVAWYDARVQVAVVRLLEDGSDQLFVGGTDSKGRSGFHVYAAVLSGKPALKELSSFDAAPGLRFDHMQVVPLRRAPRQAGLVVDFVMTSDTALGKGVLVWAREGRLQQWSPPDCPTPLEVQDQGSDQAPLLLAKHGGAPAAFRWTPSGPVTASP